MLKQRLFLKIILGFGGILLVCLVVTCYFSCKVLKEYSVHLLHDRLKSHAELAFQMTKTPLGKNNFEEVVRITQQLSNQLNVDVAIASPGSGIIIQTQNNTFITSIVKSGNIHNLFPSEENKSGINSKNEFLYVVLPIDGKDHKQLYCITSCSLYQDIQEYYTARKAVILSTILIFNVTLVIGFVLAKMFFSPLSKTIRIACDLAKGNFSRKIKVSSSDEVGELAIAINTMGAELQTQSQTIREDKNKLDAIMENMNDAVITTDFQERIILINNAAKAMFEIPDVSLYKDFLWERIRNEKLCKLVREIIATQESVPTVTSEIEVSTPIKKILQTHLSPIQIDKDTQGILIVFHDMTEIRKLENTRREFVANVSHELRTPLTSIKGYVETLLEDHPTDQQYTRECLTIIMKHTQRLDSLIKDILELSRLESEDLKIELVSTDIIPCLENIVTTYKEHCDGKKQTLEIDITPDLSLVETNEYLLRQLLTNLIDNAVKYTPEGGRVGVKVEQTDGDVQFEISDSGIGIPKKHISRIFERFYRVDLARSREMGGTGLGLSIVKHIVNLHHGTIKLETKVGAGCRFIITLPRKQQSHMAS